MTCVHCGESFKPYESKDSKKMMNLAYWVEPILYCEDCIKELGDKIERTVMFFEKENEI